MPSTRLPFEFVAKAAVILAAGIVALWLWHCWCVFPYHSWNELRLAPAFLWANGLPVYAPENGGPVTTWIYGPLPFILLLPATLANSAGGALLVASGLNFVIVAGSLLLCCLRFPAQTPLSTGQRLGAWLACLAFWPESSFQYLQADNPAIAFGLLGTLFLLRAGNRSAHRWLAALFAAAALACKQTAIEAAAAQLAWIGIVSGWRAAGAHLLRLAACGGALAVWLALTFDVPTLWFNLVAVPGNLPWKNIAERLYEHGTALGPQIVIPALLLFIFRHRVLSRESPLLLPTLCWSFSLITGLAGFFKIGGSVNSLHGLQYLLPAALIWGLGASHSIARINTLLPVALLLSAALCSGVRLAALPVKVWRPLTMHLDQAAFLARELPGEVWFPWNPLVTFYAERRFDHTEDGLETRRLANHAMPSHQLKAHLPPHWHVTALRTTERDWQLATGLSPASATVTTVGLWRVFSWETPAPHSALETDSSP